MSSPPSCGQGLVGHRERRAVAVTGDRIGPDHSIGRANACRIGAGDGHGSEPRGTAAPAAQPIAARGGQHPEAMAQRPAEPDGVGLGALVGGTGQLAQTRAGVEGLRDDLIVEHKVVGQRRQGGGRAAPPKRRDSRSGTRTVLSPARHFRRPSAGGWHNPTVSVAFGSHPSTVPSP